MISRPQNPLLNHPPRPPLKLGTVLLTQQSRDAHLPLPRADAPDSHRRRPDLVPGAYVDFIWWSCAVEP